jgi:ATP-dependent RNA helicase DHX57
VKVPQFILDHQILSNQGSKTSILVTQPRRLSAIGVSTRVSAERVEDGSVGYAIRGESKQTKETKLLFCTTGVVLRRLAVGDSLEDVTHIIIDEVCKRSPEQFLSTAQFLIGSRTISRQRFPAVRTEGTFGATFHS